MSPTDLSAGLRGDGAATPAAPSPAAAAPAQTIELLLRLQLGEHRCEVAVTVDADHRVADLSATIAAASGLSGRPCSIVNRRTGERLPESSAVAEIDLVSGDVLLIEPEGVGGDRPANMPARSDDGVAVDVVAGPDSGCSHVLGPGRHTIGRRSSCHVVIGDPSVSRVHAELHVHRLGHDDWSAVVHPAGDAANGVTVNDEHIHEPTVVAAADVVGLGGTRFVVREVVRARTERIDRLGQIDFHRTPYRPPTVSERDTVAVGPIPERAEPRRFQVFAALAPLAAGLMMYAFTRQVTFLALTLISPVVMIANVVEDRRTGRRRFTRDLAEFRARLVETQRQLERLRHDERTERLRAAPDLADLIRRAELRTADLWARGRTAPDFLRLRVGLGTDRVGYDIELERGGDDDLRAEAAASVAGLDAVAGVPVTVDLPRGPLGLHGDVDLVDGVVTSLVVQAAVLHSPDDLTIAAAVAPERRLEWTKWLPHLRSVTSPIPGNHLALDRESADALVRRLIEVAELRAAARSDHGTRDEAPWPRVLLVLDGELGLDPAEVAHLLDVAAAAGVSVIWLAADPSAIPRQACQVLEIRRAPGAAMVGRLWSTDPDEVPAELEIEHLRRSAADRAARALAPVRDASTASLATSIPRTAPLLDVLGMSAPTANSITAQWQRGGGDHLRFPIGIAADGPLELDLVHDGPHTLIGGTSGAGKSELLQSMVAGLAARYSPTRLNFLFVDYKGGASSQVFERLPHTVGYVTNLSADLSIRALTSLRAELNRRMTLLEGRAKDLAELLERHPDDAPPSLVIVVDEFATLVKEVPEFVAGIIDIAQRGRSLGIHLVLATQRPSGSVNENILANTNLRISLRMLDRTDSSAIIDSPDAADIPVPLRGRALVRLGPRRLVEFQSAFAGAPVIAGVERQPVLIAPFDRTDASARPTRARGPVDSSVEPVTQLDVLLDAIVDADASLGLPAPRRPWRDVLPEAITLDRVLTDDLLEGDGERDGDPGRHVTVGLLDAPEEQAQHPAVVDLEQGGGWLVFGCGGSGKTTLLRTVAASIGSTSRGDVAMLAFDFASRGLAGLAALPEMIDVATGDDLEAVTRRLAQLDDELERRRRLLADAGAESLTTFHRDHPGQRRAVPRIVVLIDGFGGLRSTLLEPSSSVSTTVVEEWGERIQRIIVDGRQVGIHTIITADRRNAVPARIHAAISNRLILRHADEGAYAEHGITADRAKQLDLSPGRGLLQGTTLVQVATVSKDHAARAQADAISQLAADWSRPRTALLASMALPEQLAVETHLAGSALHRCTIGVGDISGQPVVADVEWSHLVICGAPRTGRSTAAHTAIRSLVDHHEVAVVGPASSPLAGWVAQHDEIDACRTAFGRGADLAPVLERLADQVTMGGSRRPPVLVVDDADLLDDPALTATWERLMALDELRLVVTLEQRSMTGYTTSAVVNAARRSRRLLVLQPDDPAEFLQITGLRLPVRPGLRMVPGRGVLITDRSLDVVQVPSAPGADGDR